MNKKQLVKISNLSKKYNLEKLKIKNADLFEISNKYQSYGNTSTRWYLKFAYVFMQKIAFYIAKIEANNTIKH